MQVKTRHITIDHDDIQIYPVHEDCNMIDFAKKCIGHNYDPDSGSGYFQFVGNTQEYVSPNTQVILVNQVSVWI